MGIYPNLGLYPATCWVGGRRGIGGNVFRRMDVINDFNSIPYRRLVSRKSQAPQVGRVDRRGRPDPGPAARRSTPRLGLASDTPVEESSPRDDGLWPPCERRYERHSFIRAFVGFNMGHRRRTSVCPSLPYPPSLDPESLYLIAYPRIRDGQLTQPL